MTRPPSPHQRMPVRDALRVMMRHRTDQQLVVTNQGSARIWPSLGAHDLDFHYNPSSMGAAIPLAFGLAVARPDLEIVVISGDGALLMNLGCLVSVASGDVLNLTIVVLDNGLYEVTGGQRTAAAAAHVDYALVAKGAGLTNVHGFDEAEKWEAEYPLVLAVPGPRFICLQVSPADPADLTTTTAAIHLQLDRLRQRLASCATSPLSSRPTRSEYGADSLHER